MQRRKFDCSVDESAEARARAQIEAEAKAHGMSVDGYIEQCWRDNAEAQDMAREAYMEDLL